MYYDKPWTRFPPYGIGMLLALLFVHLRRDPGKEPTFLSNGVPDVDGKKANLKIPQNPQILNTRDRLDLPSAASVRLSVLGCP